MGFLFAFLALLGRGAGVDYLFGSEQSVKSLAAASWQPIPISTAIQTCQQSASCLRPIPSVGGRT